ncbi:Transducin beta-like protein 2 [Chamberlinius hualienensis]
MKIIYRAFIIARSANRDLEVFRTNKLGDGNLGKATSSLTFAQHHKGDIVGLGIASSGKFIMTCSADTKLIIWSSKGEILTSIDTRQIDVYYADVSPCGRFVASCGFTSDVKVWQVVFDKTAVFKELARAFELKGHSAGVESFAFNSDSSRMVSVSKDKTWKFWDTNVEFEKGQDPRLLFTVNTTLQGPATMALSLDARVVAIASASTLRLYSTSNGKEECSINNEGHIQSLSFDPQGNVLAVAVEKHVRLFHNVVGYQMTIQELEEQRKKPSISQSLKQRMLQQITEARAALQAIGEN